MTVPNYKHGKCCGNCDSYQPRDWQQPLCMKYQIDVGFGSICDEFQMRDMSAEVPEE